MEFYRYFGLQMSKKSCWMDTSLMALFFPDKMHNYFSKFVKKLKHPTLQAIKQEIQNIITIINTVNQKYNVDRLRNLLSNFASSSEQRRAFEKENSLGYVYYYLVEFLKLLDVPPIQLMKHGVVNKETYILELENCDGTTIQECLDVFLQSWSLMYPPDYLIIEMTNSTLVPMENIQVQEKRYQLQSMIVSNCNHFITYVKKGNKWLLYDDFRTLHKKPLTTMEFGQHYVIDDCHFAYGQKNTFFFYIVMP